MTDKEIINRLTELAEFCRKCGNLTKENDVLNNALELINRQQAEIERLNDLLKRHQRHTNSIRMIHTETAKKIKTEAIKEFADRLNKRMGFCDLPNVIVRSHIDHLIKEMVGDDK